MGHWDERQGELLLSSKEFPRILKEMQSYHRRKRDRMYEVMQDFWRDLPRQGKANAVSYHRAVQIYCYGKDSYYGRETPAWIPPSWLINGDPLSQLRDPYQRAAPWGPVGWISDIEWILAHRAMTDPPTNGGFATGRTRPRRITVKDYPRPNGATTDFEWGETQVSFDRKTRTMDMCIESNKGSCERHDAHPDSHHLWKLMDGVNWTRGTGGVITEQNEYNVYDGTGLGGGGRYLWRSWGPRGEQIQERGR